MKNHILFLCTFIFYLNLQNSIAYVPLQDVDYKFFLHKVNLFSNEFYQNLSKKIEGNLFCSPISVLMVTGMAAYGAEGNTKIELAHALHLPMNEVFVMQSFDRFTNNLRSPSEVKLYLINKLFVQNQIQINPIFQRVTNQVFKSEIENVNFHDINNATKIINNWCSMKTNNKIKTVIKPDDLIDAKLVMINAVYFKGNWEHPFSNIMNRKKNFYLSKNNFISISMMCNSAKYNHGSIFNYDAHYIELPYKTNNSNITYSMYIIFPKEINRLDQLTDRLHEIDFGKLNGFKETVDLCMPKFKIESELNLMATLKDMGINDMFNYNSDLSVISNEYKLKVSKIIQKVFINVDENGSEATAASAFGITEFSLPTEINIDRPFISVIVSKTSGTPLFWARVNDPRT